MMRPVDRPVGFTLVEVMVAMTILSLVMLITVTGLRTLANTQVAIDRVTDRVDEVRTVSSFLRDTLESAVAGKSGGGLTLGGDGGEESFFRVLPQAVQWKAIVLFGESYGGSYLVQVAREDKQLVLRWQEPPASGRIADWSNASSRVLIESLDELSVSYRRGLRDGWREEWDSAGVPQLLKLQIKASGRFWPELIVRLRD